jgi:hypothetical protein
MHRNKHWAKPAWLISLLIGGSAVAASSVESDLARIMPLSLTELINLPVVTASRQLETRDQTPSHILVITREQIRERRYRNLADLLRRSARRGLHARHQVIAFNNFSVQGHVGPQQTAGDAGRGAYRQPGRRQFSGRRKPGTVCRANRWRCCSARPPRCMVPMPWPG